MKITVMTISTFLVSLVALAQSARGNSVDAATGTNAGGTGTSHFRFTYNATIPRPASAFSKLRVWLPVVQNSVDQKIDSIKVNTELKYELNQEAAHGNRMFYAELSPKDKFPSKVTMVYELTRKPAKPEAVNKMTDASYWSPDKFLGIDKKVPITGEIAEIAKAQTRSLTGGDEKIRAIYKYVTDSMTYNKDGTGWGEGDAQWACDSKRGNCTDFHSLFIGMVRSQNIAAKFEIGFPIPDGKEGVVPGYHCWAWVFSQANRQWWPLDSSEAKKHGKLFEYLGHLPSDRIQFTNSRDIVLSPAQAGAPLNYFIYPYAEADSKPYRQIQKSFAFKRLE